MRFGTKWRKNFPEIAGVMRRFVPIRTGKLRTEINAKNMRKHGQYGMKITMTDVPYARIVDLGGRIPARPKVFGKVMKFRGSRDGAVLFRSHVRGFNIPASNYSQRGFDQYMKSIDHVSAGNNIVEWED